MQYLIFCIIMAGVATTGYYVLKEIYKILDMMAKILWEMENK